MATRREPDYSAMTSPPYGMLAFILMVYFFADAVSAAIIHGPANSELAVVFVSAVFASQAILLVMWVGLGNVAIWIRLLCALGWCLWMTLLGTREPLRWELEFLAAAGLTLLLAAAPYGLLKILGFRIKWRDPMQRIYARSTDAAENATLALPLPPAERVDAGKPPPDTRSDAPTRVQFSIVQIFVWTALVGAMTVLARIAGLGPEAILPMLILVSITAALGLTTLWAVLFGDRVGARILAPIGMVFLVTLIFVRLERSVRGEDLAMMFSALALTIAAVAAVLGMLRSVGYRVRRESQAVVGISRDVAGVTRQSATNPWDADAV
jgi:hypothetical protein